MLREMLDDKIAIVGDVHGHYDELLLLMKKLPDKRRVVFLGDLIDRGLKSSKVLDLVIKHHCSLLGNHELFFEDALRTKNINLWTNERNGGLETINSYKNFLKGIKSKRHNDWIKTLPLLISLPNIEVCGKKVLLSHAPIDEQHIENLLDIVRKSCFDDLLKSNDVAKILNSCLWNRKLSQNLPFYNIYGHNSYPEILKNEYSCGIDTGIYLPNKLTVLLLPEFKIYEQESLKK